MSRLTASSAISTIACVAMVLAPPYVKAQTPAVNPPAFSPVSPPLSRPAAPGNADATGQESVPAGVRAAKAHPPSRTHSVSSSLTLEAGRGKLVHMDGSAANVFTADPKVVEVRPASASNLFIYGVAPGTTTIAALNAAGDAIAQYAVTVVPSSFDAGQAARAINGAGVLKVVTHPTENGVELSGTAASPGDAERAVAEAKDTMPAGAKIDNRMSVSEPIQVSLHVRVAEMSRTLTRELGINWGATGLTNLGSAVKGGVEAATGNTALLQATGVSPSVLVASLINRKSGITDLSATIDALSQDQLVHMLAEPNLTAMSGQPASFLVGGEFPIPVASTPAQGTSPGTFSVDFKQYGISLSFVPTVIANDRIVLHVRPEVSAIDKSNSVTSFVSSTVSINIPALTVRRADTTVELGSGQSFAIAGLLSDQTSQINQVTPFLGEVPILGPLFRSVSFQRAQTELVIIVTPYIVRPVSDPAALHLPTDGFTPPNDFERIVLYRQSGHPQSSATRRIPVDAGFVVE